MTTATLLLSRTLWYRDEHDKQREVRIEATSTVELDRVEWIYKRLEARSLCDDRAWRESHTTFTDAEIQPTRVAETVIAPDQDKGFPWDSDDQRYEFAILLGERMIWGGPTSVYGHTEEGRDGKPDRATYGNEIAPGADCPLHGVRPLPLVYCCLFCTRTGKDVLIPRATGRDTKRRNEKMPAWKPAEPTKLPEAKRDRAGRELAGGLAGKR